MASFTGFVDQHNILFFSDALRSSDIEASRATEIYLCGVLPFQCFAEVLSPSFHKIIKIPCQSSVI